MIKVEFPADRADIALAFGQALLAIAAGTGYPDKVKAEVNFGAAVQKTLQETDPAAGGEGEEVVDVSKAFAAAGGAGGQPTHQPQQPPAQVQDSVKRDTKGVPFDPTMCAVAAEPFYTSGSRQGQWKKRKGVTDPVYDGWYRACLDALSAGGAGGAPEPEYPEEDDDDVSHAFGGNPAAGAFAGGNTHQVAAATAPQDTGSYMGWVAEKQAAGKLTQKDINDAYQKTGVSLPKLFPPTPQNEILNNIRAMYYELSAKAGA